MGLRTDYGGRPAGSSSSYFGASHGRGGGESEPIDRRVLLGAGAVAAVIILVFFILPMLTSSPSSENSELTDSQILKIAGREPITKDFIARNLNYDTKITCVNPGDLQNLIATSPAIYGDLDAETIYKIEYKSEEEGILLILDPATRTIVKYYRVREIAF